MTNNKLYTIKDISDITGVHAQTLRNWEKESLIEPIRVAGNQRIYTDEHVARVKEIISLKDEGFQLKGVRNVLLGKAKSFANKVTPTQSTEGKAKRGRPRKNFGIQTSAPLMSAAQTLEKTGAKKRGRPAKNVVSQEPIKKGKYDVEKLEAMTLKELTNIAQEENVRYFRQMFKEELIVAIADPSRRDEMKENAKNRTKERYGHKVYGERGRSVETDEETNTPKEEKMVQYAQTQAPTNNATITEENSVKDDGLVEANVVEDAKEEMDNQQLLIKQILDLGNSGKSPEEIAKELAKSYK